MPTTILSGLVDEQDVLADEKVIDIDDKIRMLEPDLAQFSTFAMKSRTKDAFNPKVFWLEDRLMPNVTTLAASATSAATTLTVATGTGDYFRANDLFRIPASGTAGIVSSVSTDTLTVVLGLGGTTAASAASGLQIVILNNASAEGATLGTRKMTKTTVQYNYCQIFRNPFGFTNTAVASKFYGDQQPGREQAKKLTEHKRGIESGMFFGPRGINTGGATPVRYMGGAIEFISTNRFNVSGTLTKALVDSYLQSAYVYGSDNKVMFASPTIATAISGFARDASGTQWRSGDRMFGFKVDGYVSGTWGVNTPIIVKKEWSGFSTANGQYGGVAFIIDLDYVWLRVLRNTAIYKNRQANDADETTHEYLSELSLEFAVEQAHTYIYGATG